MSFILQVCDHKLKYEIKGYDTYLAIFHKLTATKKCNNLEIADNHSWLPSNTQTQWKACLKTVVIPNIYLDTYINCGIVLVVFS